MEKGSENDPCIGRVMCKSTSKFLNMSELRRNYARGKEAEGS